MKGGNGFIGKLFGWDGQNWLKIIVDELTANIVTILAPHHEIHEGRNFTAWENNVGVPGVTSIIIAFRVAPGQTREPHVTMNWKTEETGVVTWYKGATWTTGTGTGFTPINSYDRFQGVKPSILQGDASGAFVSDNVVIDPTGLTIAGATILFEESVWATNQSPAGGQQGSRSEHDLEIGETYAIQIICGQGGAKLMIDWYEHAPL